MPSNESIRSAGLIAFLRNMKRHFGPRLVLAWDNLVLHKGGVIRAFLARRRSIRVCYLPSYAPELNPIELVWGQAKNGSLANWEPANLAARSEGAVGALDRIAENQPLLRSLLRGVPLSLRLA